MSPPEASVPWPLLLGDNRENGQPVYYSGEGSLVTVAPPGAGKTQCHVLPNVMTWAGPAIVLDVTGDLWRKTSKQRSRNYGPVYRIDLDDIDSSDRYNPVMNIRRDPKYAWEDAQSFANLVYIKRDPPDAFFDYASISLIAAVVCYIAMYEDEERRNFDTLLSIISGTTWDEFVKAAVAKTEIPALRNAVSIMQNSDERTKSNVRWTAKAALSAWEGYGVSTISRISDWKPEEVRAARATIYICVSPDKLESNAGFIRLIVGQQIRALMPPGHIVTDDTLWFQFFLDELPQLRKMEVIRQALDVGRQHRIRLWMFMQYQSQLETTYGKDLARGMIGACGVKAYMNPPAFDGTAELVSKALGTEEGVRDATRRPTAEPHVLAGPDYAADVITFVTGSKPLRLQKHPYFLDAKLTAMEGESP